jgi:hypothetical protein
VNAFERLAKGGGLPSAEVEESMAPIDYFMAIFVGMCIGLTGLAYLWS